ncbi:MFS transporter [Candidatus Saccharibacteria bacterium]|nr:MFS transporter [Candidatus Saccharibacteria bacterium]
MGIATLFGAAFMGSILYLTQFNQQVFSATPTESGLMLLPMIAGLMTTSITSGQIISRTGRYKIFMQVGIVVATIMVGLLSTLTPETPYLHEAIIMLFLGAGLGVVMPVMNLAVQNEFKQHEIGAATSSSQLFRSLGSTIGVALFGALLTAGLAGGLTNIQDNAYVQTLKQNPEASKIGDLNDSNTLLNLNMPDTKEKITTGFEQGVEKLPEPVRDQVTTKFKENQEAYSDKVTHAFSDSLSHIFRVSAVLMLLAAVLVFMLKEKPLQAAKPDAAPGV